MDDIALIRFQGDLADLAKAPRVDYPIARRASLKDVAEALGVPHTEIYGLFVDDRPAGFKHILAPGQSVDIHPATPPVDVRVPDSLHPDPLPLVRFLADANVGKLATLLRVLGFDTAYDRHLGDRALAELAAREQRIVLSRDIGLLKRKAIAWGHLLRSNDPQAQLREVLSLFGLTPPYQAFSRCPRCNVILTPVAKADILHRLLPKTKLYYQNFHQCPACQRIYWPGSHHEAMLKWLEKI
jgi:hypothetical protein